MVKLVWVTKSGLSLGSMLSRPNPGRMELIDELFTTPVVFFPMTNDCVFRSEEVGLGHEIRAIVGIDVEQAKSWKNGIDRRAIHNACGVLSHDQRLRIPEQVVGVTVRRLVGCRVALRVAGDKWLVNHGSSFKVAYGDRVDVSSVGSPNHGAMVAKLVRKAYARTHSEIRIPDAHGGKAGLRWGFKLDAKVLKVGDDRLGGVIVGNVVRDRVWEHHGIIFEVEAFHQAVLQPGSRMGLVAETDVGREIAGYVPVVLEVTVELHVVKVDIGRLLRDRVAGGAAEEEVGVLVARIREGAVSVRSVCCRVQEAGCLARGEVHRVGGPIGKVTETLVPVATAELHLVLTDRLGQVLVDI